MWTSLRKNKMDCFLVLIFLGIIIGILYASKINLDIKNDILSLVESKKIISLNIFHIEVPIISLLCSFIIIGFILILFEIFIESFSIGISIYYYYKHFKIKGLIYSLITVISSKLIYMFLLIVLYRFIFKITKSILVKSKGNKDYQDVFKYLRKSIFIISFIILNEFLINYVFNKICIYFSFLIK